MKHTKKEITLYNLLNRRYARLLEEYNLNAPAIIKTTELQLISDAALELKELLAKN